ncbi:MAG: sortase [Chloroflexota bacterium]|nr:sortase [Chloroflexota bacterium]
MQAQEPDLHHLSIADLESLLAEKRRNDSKRVLRAAAGRTPGENAGRPAPSPAGLTPPMDRAPSPLPNTGAESPSRHAEVRRQTAELAGIEGRGLRAGGSRPTDRFQRSGLAGANPVRVPRGPAWLRDAGLSKSVDRGLQVAEFGFFLLLLYVVGQWLFADSLTESGGKLAAELQAVTPVHAPARPTGTVTKAPSPVARPTLQPTPAMTSGKTITHSQKPDRSGEPTEQPREDSALSDRDRLVQARLTLKGPSDAALLLGANIALTGTLTTTDTLADPSDSPLPPDGVESDPAAATEIRIPKISLDARVREVQVQLDSWEWEVADFMAGHHSGTANPGDMGNVVIAGHRDIRGKVFYNLDKLKKGDDIYLYSGRGTYHYIVRKTLEVKPSSVEVMAPTTDARLTLITCTPVRFATRRLIIIADLDTSYVAPQRGH